jgi:hypothetical protein
MTKMLRVRKYLFGLSISTAGSGRGNINNNDEQIAFALACERRISVAKTGDSRLSVGEGRDQLARFIKVCRSRGPRAAMRMR